MRPVRLTMQAFGSYIGPDTIDFTRTNQNLFLVTGDTGAGKTTIFDAIVFALYGEASSSYNKKEGVLLQSQFAPLRLEPYVELVFSDGPEHELYTVRRVPRHLRRKKNREGILETTGSVTLIMPDGSEFPAKETDRKLEEIVGLTKDQFMQVAMIAQGEFMELLRAKSDDKKIIFRKLFGTGIYQSIVEELADRHRSMQKEIDELDAACMTEVSHVQIPPEYPQKEPLLDLQEKILSRQTAWLDEFMPGLADLYSWLKMRQKDAAAGLQQARAKRDQIRDRVSEGSQVLSLYAQLETAGQQIEDCRRQEADIEKSRILAEKLHKAGRIQPLYQRSVEERRLLDQLRRDLQEKEQRLPVLDQALEEIKKEHEICREHTARAAADLSRMEEKVQRARLLFQRIAAGADEVRTLADRDRKAAQALTRVLEEAEELEKTRRQGQKRRGELEGAGQALSQWQLERQAADLIDQDVIEMKRLQEDLVQKENVADKAREDYRRCSLLFEQQNREYEQSRSIFLNEQAGILAGQLVPGKPCPVCGALEHPHPAVSSHTQKAPSRQELEELAEKVSQLRGRQEKLSGYAGRTGAAADASRTAFEEIQVRLRGSLTARSVLSGQTAGFEQLIAAAEEYSRQLDAEGELLKARAEELKNIQAELENADRRKIQLASREAAVREEKAAAGQVLSAARANLQELQAEKEYDSAEQAEEELRSARKRVEELQMAEKEARSREQQAAAQLEQTRSLIDRWSREIPQRDRTAAGYEQDYRQALQDAGIEEAEWKELTERFDSKAEQELQESIRSWQQTLNQAQGRFDSAREALAGRPRPDLDKAREELFAAEDTLSSLLDVSSGLQSILTSCQQALRALRPMQQKRLQMVRRDSRLDHLQRMLSGKISGSRMDLETFVQRWYLGRILDMANRRLWDMSAGQYALRMVDEVDAGRGRNRGLDLMVYSTVTGKVREVRTLSGGESFMAALSLALGMADEIRMSSPSVSLDMMFIDEGFGSLDDHSRDQAVRVLEEMAGGSRLIGIISHVSELKSQIEDQLIVTKDEKGSHARWQIS